MAKKSAGGGNVTATEFCYPEAKQSSSKEVNRDVYSYGNIAADSVTGTGAKGAGLVPAKGRGPKAVNDAPGGDDYKSNLDLQSLHYGNSPDGGFKVKKKYNSR